MLFINLLKQGIHFTNEQIQKHNKQTNKKMQYKLDAISNSNSPADMLFVQFVRFEAKM